MNQFFNAAMLFLAFTSLSSTVFPGGTCSSARISPESPVSAIIRLPAITISPRNEIFHVFLTELLTVKLNRDDMMRFLTKHNEIINRMLSTKPGDSKYELLKTAINLSITALGSRTERDPSISVARKLVVDLSGWLMDDEGVTAALERRS